MTRITRIWIVTITLSVAVVEWLLFELIRIPYRPPADMSTFLGGEKYFVLLLMSVVFLGGATSIAAICRKRGATYRDVGCYLFMLAVLVFIGGLVVRFPLWPVTPLEYVL